MKTTYVSFQENLILLLKNKANLPGAILIDGEWGSGKTHFWNEKVKSELLSLGIGSVYISIFSAVSTKKIKSDILTNYSLQKVGINGKVDDTLGSFSKIAKNFSAIGLEMLGGLAKKNIGLNPIEIFKTLIPEVDPLEFLPNELVICIDDFERCGREFYGELFQIISYLVEHKKCKVVILANIKELKIDKKEYLEKVVHKTIQFEYQDIEELFENLVKKYSAPEIFAHFKKNQQLIVNCFVLSECKNIRTIAKFISYFSELCQYKIKLNEENIKQLAYLVIFKSITGELDGDFDVYRPLVGAANYNEKRENKKKRLSKEKKLSVKFYSMYYLNSQYDAEFSENIFNFVAKGVLDVKKLKQELNPKTTMDFPEKIFHKVRSRKWIGVKEKELRKLADDYIKKALIEKYCNKNGILMEIYEQMLEIYETLDLSADILEKAMLKYIDTLPIIETREHFRTIQNQRFETRVRKMYKHLSDSQIQKRGKAFVLSIYKSLKKGLMPELFNQYSLSNPEFIRDAALDSRVVNELTKLFKTNPEIFYYFYLNVTHYSNKNNWSSVDKDRLKANIQLFSSVDRVEARMIKDIMSNCH